jgi:hypothetical protein
MKNGKPGRGQAPAPGPLRAPLVLDVLDRAYVLLGGKAGHEQLIADVMERVRRFMAVPAGVQDPVVDEELGELRRRLQRFEPCYRQRYAALLQKHLSERELENILESGRRGETAPESAALSALRRAVYTELQRQKERMAALPLYGPQS